MDCDDVMLILATSEQRTMTGLEETRFRDHVDSCVTCQTLAEQQDEHWRWLVRIPADALDGEEILVLPTVDPIVFSAMTEVASGGMGRINRAFDRRLGREVAVKEVLDHTLRVRFEREVRITARLQHPAIVPIYEAGSFPDGASFYTMRLVAGRTLQDAISDAKTLQQRLRLMPHVRAITDALAYAHARGVIHRDLKPGNVLVGEFGETVVIDWGLAKERDEIDLPMPAARPSRATLTQTGSVIGTPCFMSPAQAAGKPADATDDVYALGAILYHVLAGKPPYWTETRHEADALIAATLEGPPTPIGELASEAPEDLRAIAERAMSRAKEERFPTAKELADELARFEAGQLLRSREYTTRELVARWLQRHRRGVVLALLGMIAAVLFAIMWVRYEHAADELAIRARGAKLTDLYGEVARQAYRIDRDLLRLESALEGLATAAAWALTGPEPSEQDARVFFDVDFAAGRVPDDFTKQTAYRWPVSIEYPVVGVAPGVERVPLMPKIRRLAPLRQHIREMVLQAAVGDTKQLSYADGTKLLVERKSPIDYAYVDLPEGIHVVWPGGANLRRDYDVRNASFYQQSDHERRTKWGAPYVDSTTDKAGDDLVVPCTKGVWSKTNEFLGVAGVEMTVTKMVDTSMTMTTRTTLRTSLVDKEGRKVIDSRDAGKLFPASGLDEAIKFTAFDLPEVADAIRGEKEGIRETQRDGHPIVAAFVRLDAIGWYYVVEVDATSLGARP